MKLVHRAPRARNAVRSVSTEGEVFVAAVVLLMLLSVLADVVGPMAVGEAGLEAALFEFAGEGAVLAIQHWTFVEFLFVGAAVALGISVLRVEGAVLVRRLVSAVCRGLGKIPISFQR